MFRRFRLVVRVASLQVSPKVLLWGLLNTLNRTFKTGNRRFEFERLYLENADPWNYRSSRYELQKYDRTLAISLKLRSSSKCALEIGCSIGIFSQMLARHFDNVTALDASKEALRTASTSSHPGKNLTFVHGYLQSLDIEGKYDVIFCAEVLYYIAETESDEVCRRLDRYLASRGIIVLVTGIKSGESSPYYFDGWKEVLGNYFKLVFEESFSDVERPYQISIFSRQLEFGGTIES